MPNGGGVYGHGGMYPPPLPRGGEFNRRDGYGYYGGGYGGHPAQGYGGGMGMGHAAYGSLEFRPMSVSICSLRIGIADGVHINLGSTR